PQDTVGRCILEFLHPEDRAPVHNTIDLALESPGVRQPFEFRFRHADGSWRVLEAIGNGVIQPDLRGVIVNSRDVTLRKRAESLAAGQKHVLGMIAEDAPLMLTLDAVTRFM